MKIRATAWISSKPLAQNTSRSAILSWMYIWVIFSLDPATHHYKKTAVLFSAVIPGPNKPKLLESFLWASYMGCIC